MRIDLTVVQISMLKTPEQSMLSSNTKPFSVFNRVGVWTLYVKEVRRFINVWSQTLLAPLVNALLFYAIFIVALGGENRTIESLPIGVFLGAGLVMMSVMQNAFANTSSSLLISKLQGNIVDVLMPPLSSVEFLGAYTAAGITRGVMVGVVTFLSIWPFMDVHVYSPPYALFHLFMASLMLSLMGVIGGLWSEKFDHISAVTNFFIVPLSFLSGTFYSVNALPEEWQWFAHLNPFFYLIDGFRYGFTGQADGSLLTGLIFVSVLNCFLIGMAWRLIDRGYKLKA